MGITDHIIKISLVSFFGIIISYVVYQYLNPINSYIANFIFYGLILTLPITLILIIYEKFKLAKYYFIFIWFIYIIASLSITIINILITTPLYSWIFAIIITGSISLIIISRKIGISFTQIFQRSKIEEIESLRELKKEEKIEKDLSFIMETLSIVQCKILLILLTSQKSFLSKKELQRIIKTTYKKILKEIDELKDLGLIEIIEIPRKTKGAPFSHGVKASQYLINEKEKAINLIKKRIEELEESHL
ncbi:MAG: hypothetical protein QW806_09725 [Nitrososphaerota archaeon]